MIYSKYQQNIFDFVANSNKSCVVGACAGSGKTSTIKECAVRLAKKGVRKQDILFLAFNKSIALELNEKIGSYAFCKTLHQHGFSAILKSSATKVNLDNKKWSTYITTNYSVLSGYDFDSVDEKSRTDLIYQYCANVKTIFDKCRIELLDGDDISAIENVVEHYGCEIIADEVNAVALLLPIAYKLDTTIDFTDMITLPVKCDIVKKKLDKYSNVFIDECQDLSKAQQELMLLSVAKGGRFIAVGDRKQAINGFAGADADSFNCLVNLADGNELPLSICYRCGKDIISLANEIVPEISAWENSDKGNVETVTDLAKVRKGDMIISRKSAPLLSLALKMIAKGMPAKVKGTDLEKTLSGMISKYKAKNIQSLYSKLDSEYEIILKEVAKKGHTNPAVSVRARNFMDRYDCIKAVANECISIAEIKSKLKTIFADYMKGYEITLSTIHKAKGLEADNVFILLPNKLPLTFKGQKEWELEQEMNLKYVAITRAKKNLYWVNLDEEKLASVTF